MRTSQYHRSTEVVRIMHLLHLFPSHRRRAGSVAGLQPLRARSVAALRLGPGRGLGAAEARDPRAAHRGDAVLRKPSGTHDRGSVVHGKISKLREARSRLYQNRLLKPSNTFSALILSRSTRFSHVCTVPISTSN